MPATPDPVAPPADPPEALLDLRIELADAVGVIKLVGAVDHASAPSLRSALADLVDDGARDVVVDCDRLAFLDSGGLTVLVEVYHRVAELGGSVTVRRCPDVVRRVLALSGLDQYLVVEEPVSR